MAGLIQTIKSALGKQTFSLAHWLYDVAEDTPSINHAWAYGNVTYVYACIRVKATNLKQVPYVVRDKDGEPVERDPVDALLQYVNDQMSLPMLLEATSSCLDMHGNAYWWLSRPTPGSKVPSQIWPMRPEFMSAQVTGHEITGYKWEYGGQTIIYEPRDIIHFRNWSPTSDVTGMPPLEPAELAAKSDYEASLLNYNIMKRGAIPSGMVTSDVSMNPNDVKKLRDEWRKRYAGGKNAGETLIFPGGGLDFKQLSISQRDMQFLELRKYTRDEICAIFGVPQPMVQSYEDATLANVESARKFLWSETLVPIAEGIAEQLTESADKLGLAKGHTIDADLDGISALQPDLSMLSQTGRALIESGQMTPNEVRDRLYGLPERDGGDMYYMPGSVYPVDADGMPIKPAAPVMLPQATITEEEDEEEEPEPPDEKPKQLCLPAVKSARELHTELWLKQQGVQRTYEKRIGTAVAGVYRVLTDEVIRNLEMEAKSYRKATTPPPEILLFDLDDAGDVFSHRIKPIDEAAYKAAAEHTIDLMALGIDLDETVPSVQEFWAQKALKIKTIPETYHEQLRAQIAGALEDGLAMRDIADRVDEYYKLHYGEYDAPSALRIAQTETHITYNSAAFEVYEQAGIEEIKWLHSRVAKEPRPNHLALDGTTNPVGKVWPGTMNLRFPGDSGDANHKGAPPEEVINCKCTTIGVVD